MVQRKTLSIVIPAHNADKYLERCLKSVRSSTFTDYEIVVVDDGSTDNTAEIAKRYADRVISIPKSRSRLEVRLAGFATCKSEILVNLDSDVEINSDSLNIIVGYFNKNPDIGALTGLLSADCPLPDFFSVYKHLYMNFIFSKLPARVTFLYGSVFAIAKSTLDSAIKHFSANSLCVTYADDTEFGQFLVSDGVQIGFSKNLTVQHLKTYTFKRLLKNDFQIPRDFARLMLRFKQKPQLSLKKPAFLHTSHLQVLSILTLLIAIISTFFSVKISLFILLIWLISNSTFFLFIYGHKNIIFLFKAVVFTMIDQTVMGLGIFAGFFGRIYKKSVKRTSEKDSKSVGNDILEPVLSRAPVLPD